MILTDEIREKNLAIFKEKIAAYGVTSEKVDEVFGDRLLTATYTIDRQSGVACEGSLLHIVLRTLTPLALNLNKILSEKLQVEKEEIIKICLLQHLGKTFMFEKNDNAWEIEKQGKLFKYANNKMALRLGARSLALAIKLGVNLTEQDIEALTIIDKDGNDEQAKLFASPLAVIIRQSNELVTMDNIFDPK